MKAYGWILLCAFLLLNACAVTKQDLEDLQKRATENETKIQELENKLAQLQAPPAVSPEEVSKLTQQNQHIFSQLQNMNTRLNNLESYKPASTPVVSTPVKHEEPKVNTEVVQNNDSSNPEDLYNDGKKLYDSKDFSGAISQFTQLLQDYPNNEYAGNSQYWIGESYYGLGDYSAARTAFMKVVSNYPSCPKFIDSQVKIALTWYNQNQKAKAKTEFQRIKNEYPKYERISVVDEWLKKIH